MLLEYLGYVAEGQQVYNAIMDVLSDGPGTVSPGPDDRRCHCGGCGGVESGAVSIYQEVGSVRFLRQAINLIVCHDRSCLG